MHQSCYLWPLSNTPPRPTPSDARVPGEEEEAGAVLGRREGDIAAEADDCEKAASAWIKKTDPSLRMVCHNSFCSKGNAEKATLIQCHL